MSNEDVKWTLHDRAIAEKSWRYKKSKIYSAEIPIPGYCCELKQRKDDLLVVLYPEGGSRRSIRIPLQHLEDLIKALQSTPSLLQLGSRYNDL